MNNLTKLLVSTTLAAGSALAQNYHAEVGFNSGATRSFGAEGSFSIDARTLSGGLGVLDSGCQRFDGATTVSLETKDGTGFVAFNDGVLRTHAAVNCIQNPAWNATQSNPNYPPKFIADKTVAPHDTTGPFQGDHFTKVTVRQGGQAVGETATTNSGYNYDAAKSLTDGLFALPVGDPGRNFVYQVLIDEDRDGWFGVVNGDQKRSVTGPVVAPREKEIGGGGEPLAMNRNNGFNSRPSRKSLSMEGYARSTANMRYQHG